MRGNIEKSFFNQNNNTCYPSLMSPMKSLFIEKSLLSPIPSVFERLQSDTEMRMRSRLDCLSAPKRIRLRSKSPNESSLILRAKKIVGITRCESSYDFRNDLSFKPTINPNSEMILKNKYLKKAKIAKSRQYIYDDEEYSNPADIEEVGSSIIPNNKFKTQPGISEEKLKNLQQQAINPDHFSEKTLGSSVTTRVYVPMFTKPFDISKIIYSKKGNKATAEVKSSTKIGIKSKPEIRPLLRPISDSYLKIEDAVIYKQIVKDRIQNGMIRKK